MTKDLEKFIVRFLKFIPVLFLGYFFAVCAWGELAPKAFQKNMNTFRMDYGHAFTRFEQAKDFGEVDILFLGSSHTYRGFDVRIFADSGFKSFNLGSSAQTPIQTKALLERHLEGFEPDTVIYEVYPGSFTSVGVESALDLLANDENDWSSVKMAIQTNHLKVYNTLFFSLYSDVIKRREKKHQPQDIEEDHYVKGGFVERDLDTFTYEEDYSVSDWDLRQNQLDAFYSIVDMIKSQNIKLILVQAPVTKPRYNSSSKNKEFDAMMENIGEYHNFNEVNMGLDDSLHFYDSHHLNQLGVEIFNRELLRELEKSGED